MNTYNGKMYSATMAGICEYESRFEVQEHIDVKNMQSFAKTPEAAKKLIVDVLKKRVATATELLQKAESLSL